MKFNFVLKDWQGGDPRRDGFYYFDGECAFCAEQFYKIFRPAQLPANLTLDIRLKNPKKRGFVKFNIASGKIMYRGKMFIYVISRLLRAMGMNGHFPSFDCWVKIVN